NSCIDIRANTISNIAARLPNSTTSPIPRPEQLHSPRITRACRSIRTPIRLRTDTDAGEDLKLDESSPQTRNPKSQVGPRSNLKFRLSDLRWAFVQFQIFPVAFSAESLTTNPANTQRV